jgi:flagellar biosynthesis protein FliP
VAERIRRWWLRTLAVALAVVAVTVVVVGLLAPSPAMAGVQPDPIAPITPITLPGNGDTGTGTGSGSDPATPTDVLDRTLPSGSSGASSGTGSTGEDDPTASIDLQFPEATGDTSNSVVIILLLTVISIAPSLLVLCTSFTRIVIVLSLTRNALGIPQVPPQQVIVGLSVFLTLFVMGPTLTEMNETALQPLLKGDITTQVAYDRATVPLREFLLDHTRDGELELFLDASDTERPVARDEIPMAAVVPAFVLSELKTAFIIGFVIFVPFLVIDLVVSAVLMGLGMMMLPPSFVSLPFKLLLFVMLDGWLLVVGTLLTSYR